MFTQTVATIAIAWAAAIAAIVILGTVCRLPIFAAIGDYIPKKDQDLDAWATNFDTVITAAPTDYGLTAGDATAFNTLRVAFTNALALATNPGTRTPVTVAAKDTARNSMVELARQYARIAQAYPAITDTLLSDAGLTIRDPIPSPIPAPVTNPILSMMQTASLQHTLRFRDSVLVNPRQKPYGAIAMQLFVKTTVGVPVTVADCVFVGQFSRMPAVVNFASDQQNDVAQYLARWVTAKGITGPVSPLFSATIPV